MAESPDATFHARRLALDANEGIAAGDIDGDGKTDLVAGRYWFSANDWAARPLRQIDDWNGYVQSNGDFLFDVNDDGRLDVIAGSFVPSEVYWYENPGPEALRLGKMWPKHLLADTQNSRNEAQLMHDLDGDGVPEWIVNSWAKDAPTLVWRLVKKTTPTSKEDPAAYDFVSHQLAARGNSHGMGVGDINNDGRLDVLTGKGWYEQPESAIWDTEWTFHDDWELHASIPMIVVDLDDDGDNDLIYGNGHNYGLLWKENTGVNNDGSIEFTEHEIDRSFSQPHTLAWTDLDGDGTAELITGKRYYGHNGNDPGGNEMPCLYYYRWNPEDKSFTRHTIEEGHVGCGLQIVTAQLNDDDKTDIAVAGKSGTYLLLAK
ncbi:FG-GAP repeat protein [Rhodopirellula maiorica SM1]|uniref:FG-GAP repeat protein n=1 Tax=Rhodopirellula maiorica SM1 TaxID=1265738 RepID=M5RIT9_9BACT|nr:FG-GAP-like repeat-containing protein [Rhodopirellula maiorica]EMI19215.1 FG-GAP repeat protein [Rhodopirellula maiorica SM1]